ncbi:MAG TPA: ATP-binding protein, partial [Chloroflexota bacterium]|nr:ATP-binding protein [Chloroflexota bacterium]
MWHAFVWRRKHDAPIAEEIDDLRVDTLRFVFGLSTAGYLIWHCTATALLSTDVATRYWELFPIVVVGLGVTGGLLRRQPFAAVPCFLTTSIISLAAAILILRTDAPLLLFPFVALIATFLLDPLAGLLSGASSLLVVGALWRLGTLAFLSEDRLIGAAVTTLLAVLAAWALSRNVSIAVKWSLSAYDRATQKADEAQRHRAELVQTLRQLDNAYYRLERANAALELAWKAAESAERSKSEFVTNISHELRTPLNLIVGFSELIVTSPESYGDPLPAAYRGDLNAIYRGAQHLLNLTEDVLDLARVGMGRLSLVREPVDLKRVVDDACDIVGGYVGTKGLWLRVEAPDNLPCLFVDRLRVRQILLNLLTNAARFTEAGGITVSIAVEGNARVVVTVSDTGKGIQPDDLSKVFDPYYHVDAHQTVRRERFEGVGLGLPLTRHLVELHGGSMGVESAVGVGTAFWFRLPVNAIEGTTSADNWRPLRVVGATGTGAPLVVLAGVGEEMAQLLQRHLRGLQVITASDGTEAIRVAGEARARAILASRELADELRAADAPAPVIGLPIPRGEPLAAALGAAAYLAKPVTRAKLRAAVSRLGIPLHTVLVVDDDPRFARLMARFLQPPAPAPRVDALLAQSGHEALRLIEATRPD